MVSRKTSASRLSLNTATIGWRWPLARTIELCAETGLGGIAPWRHELHREGVERSAARLRDSGLTVTGLCRGGSFTGTDSQTVRQMVDENRRAVDEAAAIEAECLVLVVGGLPRGSKDIDGARAIVEDSLHRVMDHARACGVPMAVEPLHPVYAADRSCITTLAEAVDLCERLGDGAGVAIDVYHVWWDPELWEQIRRAGERIMAFHVCDWLVPTRDPLMDRGMMGDGVIDIPRIREQVETTGFDGICEVEIFSEVNWWQRDPAEVVRVCIERHRRHVLGMTDHV